MDELRLTQQCKAGDRWAWYALYDRYAGRIMAVAVRYLGSRTRGEDLMQEAFIRIFHAFDRFEWRGEGSLWGWIKQTTIHLAIDQLRKEGRLHLSHFDEQYPTEGIEPEPDELNRLSTEELLDVIAHLPDGYRTVLNLYCIDGFSHRQIAEQLHILEKSSSSRLARARTLLARRLKDYKSKKQ